MFQFVKYQTEDNDLNLIQNNIESFSKSVESVAILNGRLIEDITFINETVKKIPHGLNRPYRGYIVVNSNKPSVVHRHAPDDGDRSRFLPLRCSNMDTTISIWVF